MAKAKTSSSQSNVSVTLDPAVAEVITTLYTDANERDRIQTLVAQAGANTFLAQVAGLNVPGSMADLRLARIYWLVKAGMSVTEADDIVAKLFRIPNSTARRLNSSAFARYAGEKLIDSGVLTSVQAALETAKWNKSRWIVDLAAPVVRNSVWEKLRSNTWPNPERGDGASLKLPNDTYQGLRKSFQMNEKAVPE